MADLGESGDLDTAWRTLRAGLIENRWLLTSRSTALPGLGSTALAVYDGVAALLSRTARETFGPEVTPLRFPPVFSAHMFEQTDYVASFPQLAGTINSFRGGQGEYRDLIATYGRGDDWQPLFSPTGLALTPAACHPLYAWLEDGEVDHTRLYELTGDCFRHEPSEDPMRFVAFRMREYVRLGTAEQAMTHREQWLAIARSLYETLGLEVDIVPANDPFFGRGGILLAANQRRDEAKWEVVTEVYPGTPCAIGSGNYHDTHFGDEFGLRLPDGSTAHSACFGFGMDRTILALAARHGFDPTTWPGAVQVELGLAG